jgi:hypothetical protein
VAGGIVMGILQLCEGKEMVRRRGIVEENGRDAVLTRQAEAAVASDFRPAKQISPAADGRQSAMGKGGGGRG